jgi:hypothetical protein
LKSDLRHIHIVEIEIAVLGNMVLSAGEVIPQQQVEFIGGRLYVAGMILIRRRVSGFIVVSHIISGSFSPSPLDRWTLNFLLPSFAQRGPSHRRSMQNSSRPRN